MSEFLTTSLIGLMLGLGPALSITPREDGGLVIEVMGYCSADNTGTASLRYAGGTAPAAGDAPTGTVAGSTQAFRGSRTACAMEFVVCSVMPGRRYWLDIDLAAPDGGVARVEDITVNVVEYGAVALRKRCPAPIS